MTYEESLAYLSSLGRFGIKLGLERTRALLAELGNPQELFQGVLVAGTNGFPQMQANLLTTAYLLPADQAAGSVSAPPPVTGQP